MESLNSGEHSSSLEEEVTCSICLEMFSDPVTLPCLHSFCIECIRDVPRHFPQGTQNAGVICPQCRVTAQLPDGVDGLPRNFGLANIVTKLRQKRENARMKKKIPKDIAACPIHCKELGLYCMTCHEFLCTECFLQHALHDVVNTSQAQEKCLGDLNNMVIPQLSELHSALEEKCQKWKDAEGKTKDAMDSQLASVSQQFDKMREELAAKESETVATIKRNFKDSLSKCQKEHLETKTRLDKTKGLQREANNLNTTDPITALQCYGDFAERVKLELQLDVQGVEYTIDERVYTDQVAKFAEKIIQELLVFTLRDDDIFDDIQRKLKNISTPAEPVSLKLPTTKTIKLHEASPDDESNFDEFELPPHPPPWHGHRPPHHWGPPHHRRHAPWKHFPPPPPHHMGHPPPPRHQIGPPHGCGRRGRGRGHC